MTKTVPVIRRAACFAMAFFILAMVAQGEARAAAPTPTAAQPGMPNSIAVIGDSMSVATGTAGIPASEQPANSWSTGTNATVNSLYQRLLTINPAISGKNYNLASNGEDMLDGPAMANNAPIDTQLVTLQLGGNNLCKSNVGSMTSLEEYRSKFVETLNILQNRVPNALVQIQSVPDIFNLWFLRGAPNPPNDQPSSRAGTARTFWNLGLIPCQSLVTSPTSMAQADIDRRETVRQRNIDYNKILAEECEARLRCRFDRYATFNFSANRTNPPEGPYAPRANWQFVDDDISTIDHFHPSMSGQTKMAKAAWESGYDFTDTSMPSSSQSVVPTPPASGVSFVAPTVNHVWNDTGGIKGVQYRTHQNGNTTAWQTLAGSTDVALNQSQPYSYLNQRTVSVPVTAQGITYVESRAMDANGNLSASRVTTVNYDSSEIPAPTITGGPPANTNSSTASLTFTGAVDGATYQCSLDGESFAACTSPKNYSSLSDGSHEFRVRLLTANGNGPIVSRSWSVDATPPAAPPLSGRPAPVTNQTGANFTFSGEPGGSFECSLDGVPFATCSSPVSLSNLNVGDHEFSVRQVDQVGNTGSASTHSWTIDTSAPGAPTFIEGPAVLLPQDIAVITFTGEPGGSFECSLDNAPFNACSSPVNLTGLTDGEHRFSVRQVDAAGNTGPASTRTWAVDTTSPAAPVIGPMTDEISSVLEYRITFTGESGGSFQCRVEEGPWTACSSPWDTKFPGDGVRKFEVRQIDAAGNVGPAAAGFRTFSIIKPAAPVVTTAPSGLVRNKRAEISFTTTPGTTTTCRLNGGAWQPCDKAWKGQNLRQGSNRLEIREESFMQVGPITTVRWTVDTVAPKLSGKPKARGKAGRFVLTTKFRKPQGKPASLEFSTAKKKPKAKAPVRKQTRKWTKKLKVKSKKKLTWVRVGDKAGNWSAWVKVR